MKKLLKVTLLIFVTMLSVSAQNNKTEQDIRNLLAEYEQAVIKRDIAFVERIWANDFIYSGTSGTMENRMQSLEYLKQERDKPTYKINLFKNENQKVRVTGNTAIVTGDWTLQSAPVDSSADEPHTDKGRITTILEKRNGRWMIIAEHESEQQHDRKLMEQQVLKLNREYSNMIQRGNQTEIERILADDYLLTDESGKVFNKAEDLETYKNRQIKIESVETLDQKVRVISNNAAIATATIRFKGTKNGKPFDITEQCTTTWVFRKLRWQIVADHISYVKQ